MIGFKVDKIKGMFFDRPKIKSAIDKATKNVLSKFGAFVRTTAKQSIRTRKKISAPGQPPSSHTGLLKRFIFFGFDPVSRSVVIGPSKLNQKNTDAPEKLEYGGIVKGKKKRVKMAPRPFMTPAFEKELPKVPDMWRNAVIG